MAQSLGRPFDFGFFDFDMTDDINCIRLGVEFRRNAAQDLRT